MAEENGESTPTLFVQGDTGEYTEYTPPEAPAFKETLPEDIRENEHLKDVNDGAELARYYVDLKSNYLRPPDDANGYEYELPEGFNLEENAYNERKQLAFDNGLNQKQFSALMDAEAQRYQSSIEAFNKGIEGRRVEAEQALKTEWGDKYEQKIEAANRILSHESFADGEFKKFLNDTKFGDNPQVVKFFAKLSDLISEDVFVKPGSGDKAPAKKVGEDGRPMLDFPSMKG